MNATMETVTIADSRLAAAVKAVGGIIPKRSQKPILTNAKLTATAAGFHVYATDLETQVAVTIGDAEGSPTGETLIPCARRGGNRQGREVCPESHDRAGGRGNARHDVAYRRRARIPDRRNAD